MNRLVTDTVTVNENSINLPQTSVIKTRTQQSVGPTNTMNVSTTLRALQSQIAITPKRSTLPRVPTKSAVVAVQKLRSMKKDSNHNNLFDELSDNEENIIGKDESELDTNKFGGGDKFMVGSQSTNSTLVSAKKSINTVGTNLGPGNMAPVVPITTTESNDKNQIHIEDQIAQELELWRCMTYRHFTQFHGWPWIFVSFWMLGSYVNANCTLQMSQFRNPWEVGDGP